MGRGTVFASGGCDSTPAQRHREEVLLRRGDQAPEERHSELWSTHTKAHTHTQESTETDGGREGGRERGREGERERGSGREGDRGSERDQHTLESACVSDGNKNSSVPQRRPKERNEGRKEERKKGKRRRKKKKRQQRSRRQRVSESS